MTARPRSAVKVLLVDDLERNLEALDALLRREDLELLKARSGREALELLLVHDVALAIIDVQMPEMDGIELAELMRGTARTSHVPIIFVTGGIHEQHRVFQGYDAGAVDFLYKPLEPRVIRHKTETFFQLYRQRQEVAELLRLNEELMAVVGHDLRNPLQAVLMTAGVLEQQSNDPAVQHAAVRLRTSGTRMRRIIDDLFDLSRARLSGGIPITRQPTDLSSTARKTIAEIETAKPGRAIALRCDGDVRGDWDEARLEQLLSNLVGNAVHHGAADTAVAVTLQGSDDEVTIAVHNSGRIPPESLAQLFVPFQPRRERTEGLGLGLYIVQQIALAHAGSVDVHSTGVEGTTFRVHLPRHADAAGS